MFDSSLIRKNYFIFILLMLLLTAALLTWMTSMRLSAFHEYHHVTAESSVQGVAKQISHLMAEKKRQVKLFVEEHLDLIRILAKNPTNEEIRMHIGNRLTKHFPDRFAFSITDSKGNPLFEDFDGLISELCLSDLKTFSISKTYNPYIHPNTEGYHFDVMIHYGENEEEGVFFVSFLADQMGPILASAQSQGHNLMLIYPEQQDLIEIIPAGSRIHWERNDYRLTEEEKSRLTTRLSIPDTRWEIVDVLDNDYMHHNYRNRLIGEATGIMSIFLIIGIGTVVRLRREELRRELAERHKEELMGVISHELRTPASVVKSALDLVMAGDAGDIGDDAKHYLGMASSSTSRLLLLVSDFLDIQKMESGQLSLNKSRTSIAGLIRNVVDANKMYATEAGTRFEIKEPLIDAQVNCDPHRIEQVLTNLLSNAVKYGGADAPVEISTHTDKDSIRVSVKDHGPGIPKQFQARVFEKFAMAGGDSGKKVSSSGLGLCITKGIIEQHGGQIYFKTEEGIGTTFYFDLRLAY